VAPPLKSITAEVPTWNFYPGIDGVNTNEPIEVLSPGVCTPAPVEQTPYVPAPARSIVPLTEASGRAPAVAVATFTSGLGTADFNEAIQTNSRP